MRRNSFVEQLGRHLLAVAGIAFTALIARPCPGQAGGAGPVESCTVWGFPPRGHPTGEATVDLVAVDLDNDGLVDVATVNQGSDDVSVLLGMESGPAFAPQQRIDVGDGPAAVATGDFNGDGSPDLATANSRSDDVSILLGRGDGMFQAELREPVGDEPSALVIADWNGDRALDLAVANKEAHSVSVLLGRGDGTFDAERRITVPPYPTALEAGDFVGDEHLDLAVSCVGGGCPLLTGDGSGAFSEPVAGLDLCDGRQAFRMAAADFNSDGRLDIAVMSVYSTQARPPFQTHIYLSEPNGGYIESQALLPRPHPWTVLAAADVTADGHPDLMSSNIVLHANQGDGTFSSDPIAIPIGLWPADIEVAHLDGDGRLDLIAANLSSDSAEPSEVRALLNKASGFLLMPLANVSIDLPVHPTALVTGDIDGDGFADLVAPGTGLDATDAHGVVALRGQGNGGFQASHVFPVPRPPLDAVLVDFVGGNGRIDVLLATDEAVYYLENDGAGGFWEAQTIPNGRASGRELAAADFNGDSGLELATLDTGGGLRVFRQCGTRCLDPWIEWEAPPDRGYEALATGDFDADGRLDVASSSGEPAEVLVLHGLGDGTFAPAVQFEVSARPGRILATDVNGDGRLDVITEGLSVLLGSQDGIFAPEAHLPPFRLCSAGSMLAADFTVDGRVDLAFSEGICQGFLPQQLVLLPGNGDGSFGEARRVGGRFAYSRAVSSDFNADGHADLAVSEFYRSRLSVLLNEPVGEAVLECRESQTFTCNGPTGVILTEELHGVTTLACAGSAPVVLCSPPAGSLFPLGITTVTCTALDASGNTSTCTFDVTVTCDGGLQLPGDASQDAALDISDAVRLLSHLFLGAPERLPCEGRTAFDPGPGERSLLDSNGDAIVDLSDAVYVLGFLFNGSSAPVLGVECLSIPGCPQVCGW